MHSCPSFHDPFPAVLFHAILHILQLATCTMVHYTFCCLCIGRSCCLPPCKKDKHTDEGTLCMSTEKFHVHGEILMWTGTKMNLLSYIACTLCILYVPNSLVMCANQDHARWQYCRNESVLDISSKHAYIYIYTIIIMHIISYNVHYMDAHDESNFLTQP